MSFPLSNQELQYRKRIIRTTKSLTRSEPKRFLLLSSSREDFNTEYARMLQLEIDALIHLQKDFCIKNSHCMDKYLFTLASTKRLGEISKNLKKSPHSLLSAYYEIITIRQDWHNKCK